MGAGAFSSNMCFCHLGDHAILPSSEKGDRAAALRPSFVPLTCQAHHEGLNPSQPDSLPLKLAQSKGR